MITRPELTDVPVQRRPPAGGGDESTASPLDPADVTRVLTAVAVSDVIDVATIAAVTDLAPAVVRRSIDDALETGALHTASPHLAAEVRQNLLDENPGSAIGVLHQRVLDRVVGSGGPSAATTQALITSGCRDQRLADHVSTSIRTAVHSDLPRLTAWAEVLGADPREVAAHAAARSAATGAFDQALRSAEVTLSQPDHPAAVIAVRAAAVAHAHRGMVHLSAGLYEYLGPDRIGADAAVATWALIGDGNRAAALAIGTTVPAPTSLGRGMALMARGLEQTLVGDGEAAVPVLVQSASTLRPIGSQLVLPDSPAAIAATVAVCTGELITAEAVLRTALEADLGGCLQRTRHRLLLAWTTMLNGDLQRAAGMVDEVAATEDLDLRDVVVMHALRVGIARRGNDLPALDTAWHNARGSLAEFSVDLYSLLALGELAVAAARVRESHRLKSHLADAEALLERLGHPPLWATMFHWYGVHAAILAEEPAELIPHADALVTAARTSRVAGILAQAGQVWLRVLQGDVDPVAVRRAAGELELIGLGWDATRLAAQAAARTPDRQVMLDLMQLARASNRTSHTEQPAGGRRDTTTSAALMTDREWEVAMLVLDGIGYREIGERLFISPKTVEHHVARIRRRLGAETRQEMLELLRRFAAAKASPDS